MKNLTVLVDSESVKNDLIDTITCEKLKKLLTFCLIETNK